MAGKRKEGHKVVFAEVPDELVDRLKTVAKLNHRSMTGEVIAAIEQHVIAEEKDKGLSPVSQEPKKGKGKKQ